MNKFLMFATDRLWLRPTLEEDADFIVEVFNTPGALRFIGDRDINSKEQAQEFIFNRPLVQLEKLGYSNYTIVERVTGAKVGVAGLYERPYLDYADMGYALLPDYEGKGYAREASRRLLVAAQEDFELDTVCAITHPENHKSSALLLDLGFRQVDEVELPDIKGTSLYFEIDLGTT